MTAAVCPVCGAPLAPAFAKDFSWEDLGRVDYDRCTACGFTRSRTHAEMDDVRWTRLNAAFHEQRDAAAGRSTPARWRERADGYVAAIRAAREAGALSTARPWLDYGAGGGHLTELIEAATGQEILRYEPFCPGSGGTWVDAAELRPGSCDLVVNTAMFEHVRDRETLDHVAGLVSPDGALALHTVIVDRVPDDPEWFYLLPVHCAFFTNAAMRRLCADWGFHSSAFYRPGKMWLLFRRKFDQLPPALSGGDWLSGPGFLSPWT